MPLGNPTWLLYLAAHQAVLNGWLRVPRLLFLYLCAPVAFVRRLLLLPTPSAQYCLMGMAGRGANSGMRGAECRDWRVAYSLQQATGNRHHFAHKFVAACAHCICPAADLARILKLPEHPTISTIKIPRSLPARQSTWGGWRR